MKKMIIGVAVICSAIAVQAATYSWDCSTESAFESIYQDGGESLVAAGNKIYLFDCREVTQNDLLAALIAGDGSADSLIAKAADSYTMTADGEGVYKTGLSHTVEDEKAGDEWEAFVAIVQDGKVMLSDSAWTVVSELSSGEDISWDSQPDYSTLMTDKEFSSGGWYQTVPEPTSGLLLLLGVAGLALRRRRA